MNTAASLTTGRVGGWTTGPKQDQATVRRNKRIGNLGEQLASELLQKEGFRNVHNLNRIRANYPGYDLVAELGDEQFFFSVKARNRFERCGRENSRYKIHLTLKQAAETASTAKAAWIAIRLEPEKNSYSAFLGYFEQLPNGGRPRNPEKRSIYAIASGISMTETSCRQYICLADNSPCPFDISHLKNRYAG